MTRQQHLEAAQLTGRVAAAHIFRAASDHPMDYALPDMRDAEWATIAAHHGRAAQTCERCGGKKCPMSGDCQNLVQTNGEYGCCNNCDGVGWLPCAEHRPVNTISVIGLKGR